MDKPNLEQLPIQDLTLPNVVLRDLMQATLAKGLPFRFRALGSSMSPFIREGDLVTIRPWHDRRPAIGQVVAFIQPESGLVLVHRVIQRQGMEYLIQGDNTPGRNDGLVPMENILGSVDQVKRAGQGTWFGRGVAGWWIALLSRFGMLRPIISRLKILIGKKKAKNS